MNVTIKFTPEEEARLKAAARSSGFKVEDLVHRLVLSQLPPAAAPSNPTLALLEAWDQEDATDDPVELAARRRNWDEVLEGLSANLMRLRSSRA